MLAGGCYQQNSGTKDGLEPPTVEFLIEEQSQTLLLFGRLYSLLGEVQVLVIKAEIRQRRHRNHGEMVDASVGSQGKSHKRIFNSVVAPAGLKGVVLPVLKIGDSARRVIQTKHQLGVFQSNG